MRQCTDLAGWWQKRPLVCGKRCVDGDAEGPVGQLNTRSGAHEAAFLSRSARRRGMQRPLKRLWPYTRGVFCHQVPFSV